MGKRPSDLCDITAVFLHRPARTAVFCGLRVAVAPRQSGDAGGWSLA